MSTSTSSVMLFEEDMKTWNEQPLSHSTPQLKFHSFSTNNSTYSSPLAFNDILSESSLNESVSLSSENGLAFLDVSCSPSSEVLENIEQEKLTLNECSESLHSANFPQVSYCCNLRCVASLSQHATTGGGTMLFRE